MALPELRAGLRRPGFTGWSTGLFAGAFVLLMAWTLSHELPPGGLCLACAPARLAQPGPYVLFLAVEMLIPLLVLRRRLLGDAPSLVALATLLLLPWIGGSVPDAIMRISMPGLVYLFALSARHISALDARRLCIAWAAVLAVSGPTLWGEVSFHVEGGARHAALPRRDPLAALYYVTWARRTGYTAPEFFELCGWQWRAQYFTPSAPPSWPDPPDSLPRARP